MLKPSPQLSCQLSSQQLSTHSPTNSNPGLNQSQSPPEIIRPKPRRMTSANNGSQTQLSRHCTSTDLSQSQSDHLRSSPCVAREGPAMGRPNTPLSPFRRDAVGGSAPVLSHISNRRDGSPKFSLSPFQGSTPVKNISGRDSIPCSGRSQTPQKAIKLIRETPPIKAPLTMSNPKPRNISQIQTTPKLYEQIYGPSVSVTAIDEQSVCEQFEDEGRRHRSTMALMNHPLVKHSPSTTECGSLSKSSSDGDHIINKKKVLSKLKSRRRNILCFASPATVVTDDTINCAPISRVVIAGKVRQGCYGGSSSDENRSSGHASMSDSHRSSYLSGSPVYDMKVDPKVKATNLTKADHMSGPAFIALNTRHSNLRKSGQKCRKRETESIFLTNDSNGSPIGGLDGVRAAIEHMSLRTHGGHSTSTYSSNYSGSEYSPTFRRLIRHSSLETIGTNITSADNDFVWVDSHSRLVELQHYPWSNEDVLRLLQQSRLKNQLNRISMECVPRLSYLLQRPLVRIASEAQRFAKTLGLCTKHEICGALKVILSASLADLSIKSGHRSAAIFAVSGCPDICRQSKSVRAGLQFSVGKFHRWMCDVKMGHFVDEYAAIYMTSAIENLFEEIILQCLSMQINTEFILTADLLDTCIANNSEFWALLQPFAHLMAGRTANGLLSLPAFNTCVEVQSTDTNSDEHKSNPQLVSAKTLEQQLLTTCVGSVRELGEIIENLIQYRAPNQQSNRKSVQNWWSTHTWSLSALYSLYYYMRCAQLEHSCVDEHQKVAQELVYERPYLVLPPLYEWLRVSSAQAYYRRSQTIDKDDVLQAARILLPGIDCPPNQFNYTNSSEMIELFGKDSETNECSKRLKIELAFKMLSCGRTDLLPSAIQLLPNSTSLNTVNSSGLTVLMQSCITGDSAMVEVLCESHCNVNIETPIAPNQKNSRRNGNNGHLMSETQHWTALNYATIQGHIDIVRILLEHSAYVEGGYRMGEERVTQTPLQLAASSGRLDIVALLLSYGADPFLSTTLKDSMSHCGASRGCPSAICVAAIHGQRLVLRALLAHPLHNTPKEVLSLEEMLAESSANYSTVERRRLQVVATNQDQSPQSGHSEGTEGIQWTKSKLKVLQEAMYHSAENGNLEITLDFRNIGIPWTLHTWMQSVANAHEMRLEAITDQLLQDFLHLWPEDCSLQFVDECLPLLFSIFRSSRNSGTSLLLADIFSTCYGKEKVKPIANISAIRGARIDAKYVNNKEMSDCVFKVENRVFYAHKIILVNASKRFQSMLSTNNNCNSSENITDLQTISPSVMTPIVINDIRFDIFQKVMQFLYNGGFDNDFEVELNDILELMSAASYLQLEPLLRYCEVRCSEWVSLDNVVSIYMNAMLYNAKQLIRFCQTYILQNLLALLTFDPQLAELLFAKKALNCHNIDLLSALLATLQNTVRHRQTPPKNHFNMKSNHKNQI